jgi:hypothetical protein
VFQILDIVSLSLQKHCCDLVQTFKVNLEIFPYWFCYVPNSDICFNLLNGVRTTHTHLGSI